MFIGLKKKILKSIEISVLLQTKYYTYIRIDENFITFRPTISFKVQASCLFSSGKLGQYTVDVED